MTLSKTFWFLFSWILDTEIPNCRSLLLLWLLHILILIPELACRHLWKIGRQSDDNAKQLNRNCLHFSFRFFSSHILIIVVVECNFIYQRCRIECKDHKYQLACYLKRKTAPNQCNTINQGKYLLICISSKAKGTPAIKCRLENTNGPVVPIVTSKCQPRCQGFIARSNNTQNYKNVERTLS